MHQCHKYGFKLSTTEFNWIFRTSVIPAAPKAFKIVCFPSSVFKNWYTLHTVFASSSFKVDNFKSTFMVVTSRFGSSNMASVIHVVK